mgnify:CR=1 FL=1
MALKVVGSSLPWAALPVVALVMVVMVMVMVVVEEEKKYVELA